MALTTGNQDIRVALVDGPVSVDHPDLAGATIRHVVDGASVCSYSDSIACGHGTFLAGILVANRNSAAPAICPGCTLLVRPVFTESPPVGQWPTASQGDVASAIVACVEAGARVINLSAATVEPTTRSQQDLRLALDYAARRGTITVAAAGNQSAIGSSEITRHPGVIAVVVTASTADR